MFFRASRDIGVKDFVDNYEYYRSYGYLEAPVRGSCWRTEIDYKALVRRQRKKKKSRQRQKKIKLARRNKEMKLGLIKF